MVHLWRKLLIFLEYFQGVPSSYLQLIVKFPAFDFSLLVANHVSTFRRVGDRIMRCVGCWSETTPLCSSLPLASPATMAVSRLITFSDGGTASAMVGNKAPFCNFSPNSPTITFSLFPSVTWVGHTPRVTECLSNPLPGTTVPKLCLCFSIVDKPSALLLYRSLFSDLFVSLTNESMEAYVELYISCLAKLVHYLGYSHAASNAPLPPCQRRS